MISLLFAMCFLFAMPPQDLDRVGTRFAKDVVDHCHRQRYSPFFGATSYVSEHCHEPHEYRKGNR